MPRYRTRRRTRVALEAAHGGCSLTAAYTDNGLGNGKNDNSCGGSNSSSGSDKRIHSAGISSNTSDMYTLRLLPQTPCRRVKGEHRGNESDDNNIIPINKCA